MTYQTYQKHAPGMMIICNVNARAPRFSACVLFLQKERLYWLYTYEIALVLRIVKRKIDVSCMLEKQLSASTNKLLKFALFSKHFLQHFRLFGWFWFLIYLWRFITPMLLIVYWVCWANIYNEQTPSSVQMLRKYTVFFMYKLSEKKVRYIFFSWETF